MTLREEIVALQERGLYMMEGHVVASLLGDILARHPETEMDTEIARLRKLAHELADKVDYSIEQKMKVHDMINGAGT